MSSNPQPSLGRRLGRSIYWIIRTTLITLILIVVLVGLPLAAFFAYQEILRSFDSVLVRVEANSRAIGELTAEVDDLQTNAPAQQSQLAALERDLLGLDGRLATTQSTLNADLVRQAELLSNLEAQVLTVTSSNETALGDAVTALQSDINRNGSQVDSLGGEVDRLQTVVQSLETQTAVLNTGVTELQAAAEAEVLKNELRQTLALFHVWELITRARLRLAENNVGLATKDVETAVRTLDTLIQVAGEAEREALGKVQGRLVLAFASLPNAPQTAVADLETAWNELDTIVAALVLPQVTLSETPVATPTPTPAPAP